MIFRIQSFKQAAFWSTAIGAFSQVLALVFGMVMAAVFGAQESTDVLYYCLGVFALLSALVQQVNVSVLVPETMRRRAQIGEADAMAFINRFFAAFLAIILAAMGLMLHQPASVLTAISRFPAEVLHSHHGLVLWLVVAFPLQMVAQLLLDILVSYRFLTLPAVLSCVGRAINIGFVLAFWRRWGVESAAMGMAVGFGLQILVNTWFLARAIRWRWTVWRTRIGGAVYQNIFWTELGTLAATAASYLPLFFFSGFSAGAMTAMNYARRLVAVPTGLLTSQVSSVAGIKFNELAARGEVDEISRSFDRLCRALVFFLVPLAFGLMLVSHEVTDILFGRGAFGPTAVHEVAVLFGLLIMVLPLEGMNTIVARVFISRQAILQAVPLQVAGSLLNAGAVYLCIRLFGEWGYPTGIFLFWCLYFLLLAAVMPRVFRSVSLWPSLGSWLRTMGVCGTAAGGAWAVGRLVGIATWNPWLSAVAMLLLFTALCAGWAMVCPPDRDALRYGLSILRQVRTRKDVAR